MENDPGYVRGLESIEDENYRRAWLYGDWDVVAGSFFGDLWRKDRHVLEPFKIPSDWYCYRTFDWGSAKPFSVGWWAIADGTKAPDGVYYRKNTALGRRDSDAFRQYIEKLTGASGQNEGVLFRQVCDCYAASGDMAAVAQALGLSKERVRRILITEGAYTNDLISQIAWLHDSGKGKSVAEIAEILKISSSTVHKNMAYGK